MSTLAVLDRTLADSNDRDSWLDVHDKVIGSSTAGKFAKPGSVEMYVRQILEPRTFSGNAATESGNRWEPILLAFAGARPNSLFVHHPGNRRFAATVDGTLPTSTGFAICETKAKHNQIISGPTPYELRQLAWQMACIPEAEFAAWVWGELVRVPTTDPDLEYEWALRRDPQTLIFHRDDTAIVAAQHLIIAIAENVLRVLDDAREEAWT